jgi:hypothetical protein
MPHELEIRLLLKSGMAPAIWKNAMSARFSQINGAITG